MMGGAELGCSEHDVSLVLTRRHRLWWLVELTVSTEFKPISEELDDASLL